MSDVDNKALLMEIAKRQNSIIEVLEGLAKAQEAAQEKYADSDKAYREQLERNDKDQAACAGCKKVAIAVCLLALLLLAYIAYRVAP